MKVLARTAAASPEDLLALDLPRVRRLLAEFVSREVRRAGFERVVVGLSGGVDSALAAAIGAEALGASNVRGVRLPFRESAPESLVDAESLARHLDIALETVEITAAADALAEALPGIDRRRRGNVLARLRMIALYDLSARDGALVLGTSNKSELLLGYSTLHGDAAAALNPLGDLYKTQVYALAHEMGLPGEILRKRPTPDLWPGQTSEQELGFSYEDADRVLVLLVDERYRPEECVAAGAPRARVEEIVRRVRAAQFKRRPPTIAKISPRTIPIDFRYLRDWGT